ncbi:type II toxin-antitoxin system HipA family toxin YjjJ [Acidithiobacillus sp. MC6.1]|nr:type II toxin-antitoxin system HipA family toxin YjjJ [Acidithiobacillus sp. MC6.1]
MKVRQLTESTGVSQPTISRALTAMGDQIVRIGSGPSIQYAIRDASRGIVARGIVDVPVYRVDADGRLRPLGRLIPVRREGYVMRQEDGATQHFDGWPWWLYDMRPQGFLGRAYARRYADELGLPASLSEWDHLHALRALLRHGEDAVGNLLLGDRAREHFLSQMAPAPIEDADRGNAYARLADEATRGELPGSSAGGEQPKFVTYAMTPAGPRHVLVKFSTRDQNPVSERWRDLLLAEHVAAQTLQAAGRQAGNTRLLDHGGQRFLESERFDRVGPLGRRALISLAAMDGEFVGMGTGAWPDAVLRLANEGHVHPDARASTAFLYAFGILIGNTDMHFGNLSFMGDHGRPYTLAPAYDMLPMGFSPRSSGDLPNTLPEPSIGSSVDNQTWASALEVARDYLRRLQASGDFSHGFAPCLIALERHMTVATNRIARLG